MGFSMGKYRNYFVASGCILFGGTMFSLPGILRYLVPHQVQREKLTGSQRQRGMYMNAGSSDLGPDPDWDTKNSRWTGNDRKS